METKEGKPWSPITGKVAVSLVATVAGFAREKPWLQPRHQRAPRWSSRQTGPRRPPPPPPSPCHQSSPSEGPRTPARWGGRTIELARAAREAPPRHGDGERKPARCRTPTSPLLQRSCARTRHSSRHHRARKDDSHDRAPAAISAASVRHTPRRLPQTPWPPPDPGQRGRQWGERERQAQEREQGEKGRERDEREKK